MYALYILVLCALCLSLLAQTVSAQENAVSKNATRDLQAVAARKNPEETGNSDRSADDETLHSSDTSPEPAPAGKTSRWFELEHAIISTRYVFADNRNGDKLANQVQHQEEFSGRFKFDADGKYSINAGLNTGKDGGWNDTGLISGRATTNLYLKRLFFSAKPAPGVEFQYGGLATMRGVSSAITSYGDIDPVGQRVGPEKASESLLR
jgi:hypothetical protein